MGDGGGGYASGSEGGVKRKIPAKIKRSISRKRLTIKHLICIMKPR
jgi:hypothetical protein